MIKEKSKAWAKFSQQLGKTFSKLPFLPNYYTWMTLPIAVLGFLAFVYQLVLLGILLFIIAGVLDLVDGAVARRTHKTSAYGAFLDGSLDRFIDFLLIFSYFWLNITTPWLSLGQWLFIALFFAIMPSFEVAYANHRKAVDDPDEKIIWRILNRGEMYVLMLLIPLISMFNAKWSGYLIVLLAILSAITTLQTLCTTLYLANKNQQKT